MLGTLLILVLGGHDAAAASLPIALAAVPVVVAGGGADRCRIPPAPDPGPVRARRVRAAMRARVGRVDLVRAALVGVALLLAAPAAARGATWVWPVHGPVLARFAYDARTPFARGQRRGIDLGAPAGTPVVAACPGRVRFAGSVGTAGRAVSTACGAYVVSYLHLDRIATRRGARLSAGDPLGTVGTTGRRHERPPHLAFGVRLVTDRWGYVDPCASSGTIERPRPPWHRSEGEGRRHRSAPRRRASGAPPRGRPSGGPRRPRRHTHRPHRACRSARSGSPSVLALALAAVGAPLAGVRLARRRRARRTVTRPASLAGRMANW